MKIWLDDIRHAPSAFDAVYKTAEELIAFLKHNTVNTKYMYLDLDHDLGENRLSGMAVLDWIEKRTFLDTAYIPPEIAIHTDNAAVLLKMRKIAAALNEKRRDRIFYLECIR
jgi:hypothetical protein